MIGINPLRTPVLITTDEVFFHAPTDNEVDPRIVLNCIIIAERRFIKPLLGTSLYQTLIAAKNKLVTIENKGSLQNDVNTGRDSDREPIVLNAGDYVNSDTYLDTMQQTLWKDYLHKITAECVYIVALPVNRSRFSSKGVIKNHPETISSNQDSVTVDLPDLKHLLDKSLNERITVLIEDMHEYLCVSKFPGYTKDCGCYEQGTANKKSGGILFGLYHDRTHNNRDHNFRKRRGW